MAVVRICAMLDGIHTLHASLQNTPSSNEFLSKHFDVVKNELKQMKMTFEDAACVAAKLKLMLFWLQESINELIELTSSSVVAVSSSLAISGRKLCQDYVAFPHLLTDAVWEIRPTMVLHVKLQVLMEHLAKLGLRSPSEHTLAMVCAFVQPDIQALPCEDKRALLAQVKEQGKRYLDAYKNNQIVPFIEKLPDDKQELVRYGLDCVDQLVPCKVPFADLLVAMKAVPLRSSNKAFFANREHSKSVATSVVPQGLDLMGLFNGFMLQHATNVASASSTGPRITFLNPPASPAITSGNAVNPLMINKQNMDMGLHKLAIADAPPAIPPTEQDIEKPVIDDSKETRDPLKVIQMLQGTVVRKRPASSVKETKSKEKAVKQIKSATKAHQSEAEKKKKTNKGAKKSIEDDELPSKATRMKLKPLGCGKCRKRPGCCDSCWRSRKKTW